MGQVFYTRYKTAVVVPLYGPGCPLRILVPVKSLATDGINWCGDALGSSGCRYVLLRGDHS